MREQAAVDLTNPAAALRLGVNADRVRSLLSKSKEAAVDLTDPAAALRLGVDTDRWRGAVGGLDQPGGCAQPRRERGPSEGGAAVDLTDPAAALSLGVNTDQVKGGSRRA
jgi:hypothetical protein